MSQEDNSSVNKIVYRLDIEYDGTNFAGWQLQDKERTVQGVIEDALTPLFGETPRISGAGRTDAGVHASGQVAHFKSAVKREPHAVVRAVNAALPEDVRILACMIADETFHARFSAKWRAYDYRIELGSRAIGRQYCWQLPGVQVDEKKLHELAAQITGSHSFRSFAHTNENEKHYLSDVYRSEWNITDHSAVYFIEANRFLHGMVRFLVGTMMDVARGRLDVTHMTDLINAQRVTEAGMKAPAQGLTLRRVGYQVWPAE